MTDYFSVKDFGRFQHYKDRNPPWIKFYVALLENYEFCALPDASKWHLAAIWLLATRYQNRIPLDSDWVKTSIKAREDVNLDILFRAGFLVKDQSCSKLLADCPENAPPETETESDKDSSLRSESRHFHPNSDLEIAFQAYNDLAKQIGLPIATKLTSSRRASLKRRLAESDGLTGWSIALAKLEASPFCRGNNQKGWRASFDFLLQTSSFTKLIEGVYDAPANQEPAHDEQTTEAKARRSAQRVEAALAGIRGQPGGGPFD